ncbi:N-acetylglucosamine-1-phosphotransferase subunit gamma isoform X2 [Patella vulgata]|nr:N-acetylglucosamine-1-phosphotransferase subunit gamma isoform X2 [Patella vulgata]
MKIVDEPSSYGLNNNGYYNPYVNTLTMRVKPANFSGPPHLKRLVGKCFNKILESYKYKFCPFSNVTQHEQSLRWNPYSGVLGVWQEWEIRNNTFVAMVMGDGDSCGEKFRLTKVFFVCGNKSVILNVTEPHTCEYHLTFQTVLVCHKNAMLVYPMLSKPERDTWNQLETLLAYEEITQKGYQKKLRLLFEQAGLYLTKEKKEILATKVREENRQTYNTGSNNGRFFLIDKCNTEYQKLETENERLKKLLKDNGISDEVEVKPSSNNTSMPTAVIPDNNNNNTLHNINNTISNHEKS